MLWIFCNESIGEDLMEQVLDRDGIEGYTVWRDVLGKDNVGPKTHWGNSVFPGLNWVFMVFGTDETVKGVIERLASFREKAYVRKAGLKAFIHDADEVV
ncbi:MAG: hypothetical protein RQ767_00500 [Thermovirgaceae bacterium]|nr:hypothetical protein [Thermovirgaceae bacterium]